MTFKDFFQFICFVWLIDPLFATTSNLAQPGCRDTCGNNVTIPYPFGIGAPNCFLNEWYQVLCVDNKPYLSKYYGQDFGGEVLDVSVVLQEIKINANNSRIRVCEDKGISVAGNLSGSPFYYDRGNIFTFVGCGNVMLFGRETGLRYGCTSTCNESRKVDGCFGINCCEIIPEVTIFPEDFYVNFTNLVIRNDSCAYVNFGNKRNATTISDPSVDLLGVSNSVALAWIIPKWMNTTVENNPNCVPFNSSIVEYRCYCSKCRGGNPYILNGCTGCASLSRETLILIVVGSTSFGILLLGVTCFVLFKSIRKRRKRKLKEKFFKRNGGLLLQQQLSVDENMVDKVSFFTSIELDKATDNFNENRVLGRGGQGTVYKGMLIDGKIVAVKKSQLDEGNQVEQFINEVVLLSQINHRNVVKLLGCCLETEVPLLVYEFIPNGTLSDLLHNDDDEFLMSWDMRLRIATEVAGALAYLHSATSIPIYHRDVKSSNILLDEKHIAKVSDFGISRHVTIEQTHLTTIVKGTFGYLDPEYFQSNQFTDKSDVYSYGVVLVELITRQKPISSARNQTEGNFLSLATRFLISMEEERLNTILDTQILDTDSNDQVKAVAILAQRCLSLDGRKRPTMKEVAVELETIRISNMASEIQTNIQGEKDIEIGLLVISDDTTSSWTTTYSDTITSASDAYPLLSDTF